MAHENEIEDLEEASRREGWPSAWPAAVAGDSRAAGGVDVRSRALARRALGFALDSAVSREQAAPLLVQLAGADTRTLKLARAWIVRAASPGPIAAAAIGTLSLALRQVGTDGAVRLVVLGRPGAGKGTQCIDLARRLGIPRFSTGELLREVFTQQTCFGAKVQAHMNRGSLVPDRLVLRILAGRLAESGVTGRGFLLDGFPRTVEQAEKLDTLIAPKAIDAVIELAVRAETVIERLRLRARDDDTEATVARRLAEYDRNTVPVLAWYAARTPLLRVDGDRPADWVAMELRQRVDAIRT